MGGPGRGPVIGGVSPYVHYVGETNPRAGSLTRRPRYLVIQTLGQLIQKVYD